MLLSAAGIAELRKLAGLWNEEQPFPRLLATLDAYEQQVQRLEAEKDRLQDERDDLVRELWKARCLLSEGVREYDSHVKRTFPWPNIPAFMPNWIGRTRQVLKGEEEDEA